MLPAPAQPHSRPRTGSSARSLLNTIIGEFVYPAGGAAWTQTMVGALALLDVDEKAARQGLARSAAEGLLTRERVGRRVRWRMSEAGLETARQGTARIAGHGGVVRDWDGRWLLLLVTVPDEQRALGHRLRRRLTWAGFGSLGQGLWITPHVDHEPEASRILAEFEPSPLSVSFVSRFGQIGQQRALVKQAWDIDSLQRQYAAFMDEFRGVRAVSDAACFVAQTQLVHEWRRFPFIDPGLPAGLLPRDWLGAKAKQLYDERSARWRPPAARWFEAFDRSS